jgi:hypothetical protein
MREADGVRTRLRIDVRYWFCGGYSGFALGLVFIFAKIALRWHRGKARMKIFFMAWKWLILGGLRGFFVCVGMFFSVKRFVLAWGVLYWGARSARWVPAEKTMVKGGEMTREVTSRTFTEQDFQTEANGLKKIIRKSGCTPQKGYQVRVYPDGKTVVVVGFHNPLFEQEEINSRM